MKSNALKTWLMLILLATLTVSSLTSCRTVENVPAQSIEHPPLPDPAEIRPVHFDDVPEMGGLLLSYDDYRAFRANIIEYRREIADYRDLVDFYRSVLPESEQ